jgi:hypothetical protein
MNIAELKAKHPELYEAVFNEGVKAGAEEAKAEALKEGAEGELKRIQAIESHAMPGHEALIAKLKADGETTGPEAAEKILQAEKGKLEAKAEAIKKDAEALAGEVPSAEPGDDDDDDDNLDDDAPIEDEVKAQWNKDKKLRAEFGNNFERCLAFFKADASGQARILKG